MKASLTPDDELRSEIQQMFASAWQDGVHHLNPKYLRRDTLFTDRVLSLIRQREAALLERVDAEVIGENEKLISWRFTSNKPAEQFDESHKLERNVLRDEQRQALATIKKEVGGKKI